MRQRIIQEVLTGERALFMGQELDIADTIFEQGESPLKESIDVSVQNSVFRWKYPFAYPCPGGP